MMTYDEVREVLGPVDDVLVTEIVRLGATRAELVEALAWISSDDALADDHRSPPSGNVAALAEMLEADEDDAPVPTAAGTLPE
jgi:hypothetical protein